MSTKEKQMKSMSLSYNKVRSVFESLKKLKENIGFSRKGWQNPMFFK